MIHHYWKLEFKKTPGEIELIRDLDKFVREVLITPYIRKRLNINFHSSAAKIDFADNYM